MRVLVVDDELTSRIVLQETLAGYGEVDTAENGAEAVEKCRCAFAEGRPYEVICMDIMMPGMSGLEALQTIRQDEERSGRQRPNAAKVIMISARDDSESITQSFQQLCDAYLTKPVDLTDFLNILQCLHPIPEPAEL